MDLDEIEIERRCNKKQRLEFVIRYAQWVKNTPNSVWSKQQKELINSVLKSSNKIIIEGMVVKIKSGKQHNEKAGRNEK